MARRADKKVMEEVIVDSNSGEVINSKTLYVAKDEPPYIKLYLDCVMLIKGLTKGYTNVLLELLKYMTYANDTTQGGQVIALNAYLKRQIANSLNVSVKRVEQSLTEFVKKGIFSRVAVGTYQVNANIFGKGEWADIKKIRDIQSEINFRTGDIISQVVNDEENVITQCDDKLNKQFEEIVKEINEEE